ncbi:MAG: S24/S26 family peptidase [Actinomycetota bacterium]
MLTLLTPRLGPPIRATADERARPLAGDAHVGQPVADFTHGVTIDAPPSRVWPWIAQIGADRAGWYSYDRIDHGGVPSAQHLFPELGQLQVGDIVPGLPGRTDLFVVLDVEVDHHLVLGAPDRHDRTAATWALVLDETDGDGTRALVRMRIAPVRVRGFAVPAMLVRAALGPGHLVMQHRQFSGLRERAERSPSRAAAGSPVISARLLRQRAAAGGLELTAQGDSMAPTIPREATVEVVGRARPRPGEVWAFVGDDGAVLVHRYRRRVRDGLSFRGDGNRSNDAPVTTDHLIGRVVRVTTADGRTIRLGGTDRLRGLARLVADAVGRRLPRRA